MQATCRQATNSGYRRVFRQQLAVAVPALRRCLQAKSVSDTCSLCSQRELRRMQLGCHLAKLLVRPHQSDSKQFFLQSHDA